MKADSEFPSSDEPHDGPTVHLPLKDARARLGAVYPARAQPGGLVEFARRTEELGLGHLWVIEDCFLSGGLTLAACALAATERLNVGVGLMPVPLRNPALAAMEVGTLAGAFPGRFTAAFGHGVRAWMEQTGALPAQRVRALEETVAAIRRLLAGEKVTGQGGAVALDAVQLELPPRTPPDVLVGSTGPRGIDLAYRVADGILLPEGCGPAMVQWATERSPRDGEAHCVVYAWLSIDADPERARSRVEPALRSWVVSELYPQPHAMAGIAPPASGLAPDDAGALATLAEAVSVTGDRDQCAESLRRLFESGADRVILMPQGNDPWAELGQVARNVAPQLDAG